VQDAIARSSACCGILSSNRSDICVQLTRLCLWSPLIHATRRLYAGPTSGPAATNTTNGLASPQPNAGRQGRKRRLPKSFRLGSLGQHGCGAKDTSITAPKLGPSARRPDKAARGGSQKASNKTLKAVPTVTAATEDASPAVAASSAAATGFAATQQPPVAQARPTPQTQAKPQMPSLKRRLLLVKPAQSAGSAPSSRHPPPSQPPKKRPCLVAKPTQAPRATPLDDAGGAAVVSSRPSPSHGSVTNGLDDGASPKQMSHAHVRRSQNCILLHCCSMMTQTMA